METPLFENRIDIEQIHVAVQDIKREIGRVVVGQHQTVEMMLVALLANGHLLLEGVPVLPKH
jgi:MoxR-like ATPase